MDKWVIRCGNLYLSGFKKKEFNFIPRGFTKPSEACKALENAYKQNVATEKSVYYLERIDYNNDNIINHNVLISYKLPAPVFNNGKCKVDYAKVKKSYKKRLIK